MEVVHPYFSRSKLSVLCLSAFISCLLRDIANTKIGDMKEMEIDASAANVPIQTVSQHTGDKKFIIKHGSIQKFVEEAEEASDYGPKVFPDE